MPGAARAAAARDGERVRQRTILRAAVEVFAKKGYHGCRIADVAREAGVAYGLVYHYFRNKDQLLQSVFELAWSGFLERMREVAEGPGPLAEQVRRVCEIAFEAYHVDPRAVRVIILEIARSPAGARVSRQTAFAEVLQLAERMFAAAQARGELRKDLEPALCAAMIFGAVEMSLTAFVAGLLKSDEVTLQRTKLQLADALLGGLSEPKPLEVPWKKAPSATKLKPARR